MCQSTCIDHFQSVTFHVWINHLSFDPKVLKKKDKLILKRITVNTHEEKEEKFWLLHLF